MASRALDDLTPEARDKAKKVQEVCAQAGVDLLIYCTLRPLEEQARLFRQSRSWAEITQKIGCFRNRGLLGQVKLILSCILVSLVCACTLTVKFAGNYDEITDVKVNGLRTETAIFLSRMEAALATEEGGYEANRDFYFRVYAEADGLIDRASVMEEGLKKTPLRDNFTALRQQYEDLEALHRSGLNKQVLAGARAAFAQSFRAIVKHLIFLKWNEQEPVE